MLPGIFMLQHTCNAGETREAPVSVPFRTRLLLNFHVLNVRRGRGEDAFACG